MNSGSFLTPPRGLSFRALAPSAMALVLCALALVLHGCNTMQGLGQDLGVSGTRSGTTPTSSPSSSPTSPAKPTTPEIGRVILPGIAGEPQIRVRIEAGQTNLRMASSAGATGVLWVQTTSNQRMATATASRPPARMAPPVTARLTSAGWELRDASGLVGRFERAGSIRIAADERSLRAAQAGSTTAAPGTPPAAPTPDVIVNGTRYPGVIELSIRSDLPAGSFDVIEHVGIEDYLRGVVSAEMFRTWPLAAFQAQAVAARSYAIHEINRARSIGQAFDVERGVRDQAYNGTNDWPVATRAVAETRGVVLTWQSQVLRSYYHSTSGGRAASARDTWPTVRGFEYNLAGPIQASSREELGQSSPWFRWTVQRTRQEVSQRLRIWGQQNGHAVKTITSLRSARVAATNDTGRPTRYLLTATTGENFSIAAEELRRALNQDVPGVANVTRENRVNSGDMDITFVGDVATIRGRGFGHGVGMCQWSAKEMAERGADFRTILTRFYPGARVDRAY
ncbi:MAG: SpoIID/LytB domain-containing protein [Phycisphaerales bacterium]